MIRSLAAVSALTLSAAAPPIAATAAEAPMIERAKLFGNPSRVQARLSPDGRHVSWIAPRDGVMNVWVAPTMNLAAAKPITGDKVRPIRQYFWAPDSRIVMYTQDKGGDENFQLYGVDIATGRERNFTPIDKARVSIVKVSPRVKDSILIGLNNRDPRYYDIHRLELASGKLTEVLRGDGFATVVADDSLTPRLAIRPDGKGGSDYLRVVDGKAEAAPFARVALADSWSTRPLSFTADGKRLYLLDSRGRNMVALTALDMATGRTSVVAQSPRADVEAVLTHPATGVAQAYAVDYLREDWSALDKSVSRDLAFLKSRLTGDIDVVSRTDADDRWIVQVGSATTPGAAWLYDRRAGALTQLYVSRPELAGAPLVEMHPREIRTRDGLTMISYLSLPPGSDANGDGRPERAVPMVLYVHGGPYGRDDYGYDTNHQWLANRGYAVLSVNFRGSTGFGKDFLTASNLEWGRKMHDDLLDGVDWAVREGVTTADKVAVMGISYGGYATLAGLAFTPTRFACGVEAVGPSNLETLSRTLPPYWVAIREIFRQRMGDPDTPQGLAVLKAASPLYSADRIVRPLLIAQGANDPRVKQAESDQIVAAMRARDIPVTYLLFPDEGHGFARPENNLAYVATAESFLGRCLGGRVEPIGDTVRRSSMRVEHGAEFSPGLTEASR